MSLGAVVDGKLWVAVLAIVTSRGCQLSQPDKHIERTISPAPVDARLVADLLEWDRVGEHPVVILPGGGP